MMQNVVCNLCQSDTAEILFSARDRSFPQNKQAYHMRHCRRCGLIYLNPRPDSEAELAEIYPADYADYIREDQRFVMFLRSLAWRPEVREIVGLTASEATILEVGCATGEFLAALRDAGRPNVQGIEFSAQAAAVAARRHSLQVCTGDLQSASLPDSSVDVIILRHVLEHVKDPLDTLREIGRILRPAGCCIFTVPNTASSSARLFGPDWYGWQVPRHFYSFSPQVLAGLIQRANLDLVALKHSAAPNIWIGSVRFWCVARGMRRLGAFFTYTNPLALAMFAPLGIASALLKRSGAIRVTVRKPAQPHDSMAGA